MLIGANFLQEYGLVENFKTDCFKYETEGNMEECKFTNKVEAEPETQESIGHSVPEIADYNITQSLNEEPVWTISKYVAFVSKNRELYDKMKN